MSDSIIQVVYNYITTQLTKYNITHYAALSYYLNIGYYSFDVKYLIFRRGNNVILKLDFKDPELFKRIDDCIRAIVNGHTIV